MLYEYIHIIMNPLVKVRSETSVKVGYAAKVLASLLYNLGFDGFALP